VEMNPE